MTLTIPDIPLLYHLNVMIQKNDYWWKSETDQKTAKDDLCAFL